MEKLNQLMKQLQTLTVEIKTRIEYVKFNNPRYIKALGELSAAYLAGDHLGDYRRDLLTCGATGKEGVERHLNDTASYFLPEPDVNTMLLADSYAAEYDELKPGRDNHGRLDEVKQRLEELREQVAADNTNATQAVDATVDHDLERALNSYIDEQRELEDLMNKRRQALNAQDQPEPPKPTSNKPEPEHPTINALLRLTPSQRDRLLFSIFQEAKKNVQQLAKPDTPDAELEQLVSREADRLVQVYIDTH